MQNKLRVLIVDDSVVIRRLIGNALSSDPDFEVAGYAANGQIALALVEQVSPDVITLDIEMPGMSGLEVLRQVRQKYPRMPVIMFSTLTERGAAVTIDALALGASDYVTKPEGLGGADASRCYIHQQLAPKIRALARTDAGVATRSAPVKALTALPVNHADARTQAVDVVVIGSSTGGPNALAQVLPQLPQSLPVPVMIVQHMPPTFTRFLAQRLNTSCGLSVAEATATHVVTPGEAWLAPGDHHIEVTRQAGTVRLITTKGDPENSCRPSADVLFRSAAQAFGGNVLAVVLTGMGQDGLRGCQALKAQGAQIMVQDEASSVVWGMPGFVARAGLADAVLPITDIGQEIVRRVNLFRGSRKMAAQRGI